MIYSNICDLDIRILLDFYRSFWNYQILDALNIMSCKDTSFLLLWLLSHGILGDISSSFSYNRRSNAAGENPGDYNPIRFHNLRSLYWGNQ